MYKEDDLRELLQAERILIAGYGREGKSTERLYRQLCPETHIDIADGNENIREAVRKGDYDYIWKSPGVPMSVFDGLKEEGCLIISQTYVFLLLYHEQIIGITGTKGKSTTTALIAEVVRRKYPKTIMAGNMGIPFFDIISQMDEETWVVAELSCHQLENIVCGPDIAVLLNLYPEHLDHYRDYLDYKLAKLQIVIRQENKGFFYYDGSCADLKYLVERLNLTNGFDYSLHLRYLEELDQRPTLLKGEHNKKNIRAAKLVALRLGIPDEEFFDVIAHFKGLEHRLEEVGTFRGVTFYNDSISTIPASTIAACEALKEVDTLILGGFDRGIDYEELTRFLEQANIRNLVFVGEAGKRMRQSYHGSANILMESDYEMIIPWCFEHTAEGKICLLSPAAASYDAFKNFEERGRIYKQIVQQYAERR